MAPWTRSLNLQLAEYVKIPEVSIRERARGFRSTRVNSDNEYNYSQGCDEYTQERGEQLMDVIDQACTECDREYFRSRSNLSGKVRHIENHWVSRAHVHSTVKKLMQEAIDKVDDLMINIAERTVIDAMETCNVDRNKAFIKDTLRSASKRLLGSILNDTSGAR